MYILPGVINIQLRVSVWLLVHCVCTLAHTSHELSLALLFPLVHPSLQCSDQSARCASYRNNRQYWTCKLISPIPVEASSSFYCLQYKMGEGWGHSFLLQITRGDDDTTWAHCTKSHLNGPPSSLRVHISIIKCLYGMLTAGIVQSVWSCDLTSLSAIETTSC